MEEKLPKHCFKVSVSMLSNALERTRTVSLGKCDSLSLELLPNQVLKVAQHVLQRSFSGRESLARTGAVDVAGSMKDNNPPKLVMSGKADNRVWAFGIESSDVV